MLFRNMTSNVIEKVTNPIVIEQYEKRPNLYEKLEENNEHKVSMEDLKAKATEMSLTFAGNISRKNLEKLIADNTPTE